MIVLRNGEWDGYTDMVEALSALHPNLSHAVIARSAFPPASIVAHTQNRPIVNSVRTGSFEFGRVARNQFIPPECVERLWGHRSASPNAPGVYVDDNHSAHIAFHACFGTSWRRGSFTQLCHVFGESFSKNPLYFTALPNLVLVPAWLAKLTDSDSKVIASLQWAVRCTYGFCVGDSCDREPNGQGCDLCRAPGHPLDLEETRQCVRGWERYAISDYDRVLKRRDQRWLDACRACEGYSYTHYQGTT